MLLEKPVHQQLNTGIPFSKPGVRNILRRMVNAIGKIPHIVEDIGHKRVVRALSLVEFGDLFFQEIEEPREIDVLGMP
ncbi:hypothetical protein PTKU64_86310 [Paraburkholderia terrae]|uniref:Uncharacterized protein n=1 Tax=Paraburkholderia terrae TaxID=311230 RepID=A0ABN6JVF8_9BURK|nr:hypothetical protein PTKU64_86310 [Paraburkholderia terrae]